MIVPLDRSHCGRRRCHRQWSDRSYGNCAGGTRGVLSARLWEEPISQEKVHPNAVPVRVPSCCRSQSWEEWMHRTPMVALAMMLSLTAATAYAQAPAPPATPQQEQVPTGPKLNLTLEQRFTIREIIKDKKAVVAPADVQATVGEPVPP